MIVFPAMPGVASDRAHHVRRRRWRPRRRQARKLKLRGFERRKPARRPLPAHLSPHRPSGAFGLSVLRRHAGQAGEDVTETLELVPRPRSPKIT